MNDVIPENSPSAAGPRPVIGVSLKLYFGLARTRAWLAEVAALDATLAALPRPVDLFVLPSFPALADARELLGATGIAFGAQNVHWADTGAFTGEVSAGMLAEAGARYVEVGHAERRRYFGETDEAVAAKTRAATRAGLIPVICAGERRAGELGTAVDETLTQVRAALAGAAPGSEVVIAYEPVWAIGAREAAPARHVRTVAGAIRDAPAGSRRPRAARSTAARQDPVRTANWRTPSTGCSWAGWLTTPRACARSSKRSPQWRWPEGRWPERRCPDRRSPERRSPAYRSPACRCPAADDRPARSPAARPPHDTSSHHRAPRTAHRPPAPAPAPRRPPCRTPTASRSAPTTPGSS